MILLIFLLSYNKNIVFYTFFYTANDVQCTLRNSLCIFCNKQNENKE